eukprot:CAMPEP_0184295746 /NCGR_PEP_ID=MMETSP1049-20130417/6622_1 /TAXON_ID=77928 /ORGANISM="Proteomonas sulcata, Strain CCMP704" /LENGTH=269 /DNA_ID=CAMNT_0026604479 /DNA_START=109 /DNA_END=917 /DNA_ORIENTATION=-
MAQALAQALALASWPTASPTAIQPPNPSAPQLLAPQLLKKLSALGSGKLATVTDNNLLDGRVTSASWVCLDRLHDVHAIYHLAKDAVATVEMRGWDSGDEELRPVGVRAGIGHGQHSRGGVLDLVVQVLIRESVAVDGLASPSISAGEISTLAHEAFNDAVELGALIVQGFPAFSHPLLAGAEGAEVLSCLGHKVSEKLERYPPSCLIPDGDVEVDLRVSASPKAEVGKAACLLAPEAELRVLAKEASIREDDDAPTATSSKLKVQILS